jgi:hypothetical protein
MHTKRTHLAFGLFIGLALGVLGLFFIYATQFFPQQKAAHLALETERQKVLQLEQQLQKLQEEKHYLESGGAHPVGDEVGEPFGFSAFGVTSPLFVNQTVYSQEFRYKYDRVIQRRIELKGSENEPFDYFIVVWTFPENWREQILYFDCFYECHGGWSVTEFTAIKQKIGKPQTTKQGLTAYYEAHTPSVYSLTTGKYFIEVPFTPPSGQRALVEVRAILKSELYQAHAGRNKEDIINWYTQSGNAPRARQRLKEIVDTISNTSL